MFSTTRRRAARVLAAIALVCASATAGQANDVLSGGALAETTEAFEAAALRVDDRVPADPVRWTRPIHLAIDTTGGLQASASEIEASVRALAAIAGVAVVVVDINDPRLNFIVRRADPAGRAACRTAIHSQAGHIVRVEIDIWLGGRGSLSRCINHEIMHGFGFRSHAHAAHSILSYRQKRQTQFSPLDRVMMETLYDSRLQPGMKLEAAATLSCGIIAEKLRVPAQEAAGYCSSREPRARQVAAFGARRQ